MLIIVVVVVIIIIIIIIIFSLLNTRQTHMLRYNGNNNTQIETENTLTRTKIDLNEHI